MLPGTGNVPSPWALSLGSWKLWPSRIWHTSFYSLHVQNELLKTWITWVVLFTLLEHGHSGTNSKYCWWCTGSDSMSGQFMQLYAPFWKPVVWGALSPLSGSTPSSTSLPFALQCWILSVPHCSHKFFICTSWSESVFESCEGFLTKTLIKVTWLLKGTK